MAVHTKGYLPSEVTVTDIEHLLKDKLQVESIERYPYLPESTRLDFTYKGEERKLHVHENVDADNPRFTGNRTIISFIKWGYFEEIMTLILEEWGGDLCLDDIQDGWTVVERKEKRMNQVEVEVLKNDLATKVGTLENKIKNGEISDDSMELVNLYKEYEQHGTTIDELKLLHEDVLLALS